MAATEGATGIGSLDDYRHAHVLVDGIRTHLVEAGEGPPVVLLHGGEYGASAEFSWRYNIAALARHFRVYAPDMLGFGETEKVYNFSRPSDFRVQHIAAFCRALCIERAHFVGHSFGGSLLLRVASERPLAWPIDRMILVSAGGAIPLNEHRQVLVSYDGTRERMRENLKVLFYSPQWWSDEHVDERHRASLMPGAWEAVSAARLAPPGFERPWRGEMSDPSTVDRPTLVVAGAEDLLREPGYAPKLAESMPAARAVVFEDARHCPHIEHRERFNRLAVDFLLGAERTVACAKEAGGAA